VRERRRITSFRIDDARKSDLDEIIEIETLSFQSPWARQMFVEELNRDISRLKVMRGTPGNHVVAFINYWVVHDEIHILNVACHQDWRRRGLARKLLRHTLRFAQSTGARLVTLEVRRSNAPAIELYTQLGFNSVGVRPRYYENQEDAIVMLFKVKEP
jgi:ribosomal-protein-alanine N-acetyltransferase